MISACFLGTICAPADLQRRLAAGRYSLKRLCQSGEVNQLKRFELTSSALGR